MAATYISFEEAMKILGLSKQDIEELVGSGKLRAFRVKGETKFKEADVKEIADEGTDATKIHEGDIELADSATEDLLESGTEEIVFEDEIDEDAVTAEFDADDATTQELSLDEGTMFDMEGEIVTEQVDLGEVEEPRPASSSRRASPISGSRRIAEFPLDKPPVWVTALLVGTVIILLIAAMTYFQQIKYNKEDSSIPGHLKMFTERFNPGGK